MDGVRVHAVVSDLPVLGGAVRQDLGGRIDVAQGDGGLEIEVGEGQLHAEGGVHAAVVQLEELLDGLGLQTRRDPVTVLRGRERPDRVVLDTDIGIVGLDQGGVVGGIEDVARHDRRVLGFREGAVGGRRGGESRVQGYQVEGCRCATGHHELHDGAGVGAVAGQGGVGAAGVALVGVAGVVVEAGVKGRHGGGRVVVEDEGLAGVGREVHDHIGPLGGAEEEALVSHVQHHDVAAVVVVADGLGIDDDRVGQKARLVADLDEGRACSERIWHAAIAAIGGPGGGPRRVRGRRHHGHFGAAAIRLEEAQVPEAVVGGVQDAEAVGLGIDGDRGIGGAIHQGGVHEGFGHQRGVGRAGDLGARGAARNGLGAMDQARGGGQRGPEPRAVVPPAHGIGAGEVRGVLVHHVDVGIPEGAVATVFDFVPGGIRGGRGQECDGVNVGHADGAQGGGVDEGLVLDDEGDAVVVETAAVVGQDPGVDELVVDRVHDEVARSLAGVDVQAGEREGVVVVEHEPTALLVGVVVGGDAVTGGAGAHVGHVLEGGALLVARVLIRRGDPLVGGAVTDPGIESTVEVELGAVLGVELRPEGAGAQGAVASAHHGGVHGDEQVTLGARGQQVPELHADRAIPVGDDDGAEVVGGGAAVHPRRAAVLDVAAQLGGRQARVEPLGVLDDVDLVVVRTGVGGGVRHAHGDVVPQVVRVGRAQTGQPVHELLQALGVVPVAGGPVQVVRLGQLEAGAGREHRSFRGEPLGGQGRVLGGGVDAQGLGIDLAALGGQGRLGPRGRCRPGIVQHGPAGGPLDDGGLVAAGGGGRGAVGHFLCLRRQAEAREQCHGQP